MTAIWKDEGGDWSLLSPVGFPDEATLHRLVADAPQLLPLSGSPRLAVVGTEVVLGGGRADIVAIEPTGRLVIVEIKLAQNAESRRAVVAQILTYAAHLRGLSPETVEELLRTYLAGRGYGSLFAAAQSVEQAVDLDAEEFDAALEGSLTSGGFRLVIVVDEAPPELVKLTGFLEAVTSELIVDLITVQSYQIGDSRIVIPRRVDPEREPSITGPANVRRASTSSEAVPTRGKEEFLASIAESPDDVQPELTRLAEWAAQLEDDGLAVLWTTRGKGRATLVPRIPGADAGLVTIWNDRGAHLSFWRSVFERRAPATLARFDEAGDLPRVGLGNTTRDQTDALLNLLTEAYREANGVSAESRSSVGIAEADQGEWRVQEA